MPSILVVLLAIFIIFILIIAVVGYVLSSIGLYAMAKKRRLSEKAFWAWIPIGRQYLMGLLARDTSLIFGTKTYLYMHIILPLVMLINLLFAITVAIIVSVMSSSLLGPVLNLLSSVVAFVASIINLVCFYGLIKGYDRKNSASMHTAIAVFVPLYADIIIFVFRNRDFIGLAPAPGADGTLAIEQPIPLIQPDGDASKQ